MHYHRLIPDALCCGCGPRSQNNTEYDDGRHDSALSKKRANIVAPFIASPISLVIFGPRLRASSGVEHSVSCMRSGAGAGVPIDGAGPQASASSSARTAPAERLADPKAVDGEERHRACSAGRPRPAATGRARLRRGRRRAGARRGRATHDDRPSAVGEDSAHLPGAGGAARKELESLSAVDGVEPCARDVEGCPVAVPVLGCSHTA